MEVTKEAVYEEKHTWLERPMLRAFTLNWESVLFLVIVLLAVVTRFYDLETRVMSHDETSHVYFSWRLFRGDGYSHDPVTHGPLQFHLIALSYFMFGDNDFTARIPAVLCSILAIAFIWNYRRYLGRAGALVAAGLFLISPYMLYYGRYVRNEALVALFVVVALWAILRYLESGSPRYLYWLTGATVLHFTSKETAFIYVAQALVFLAFLLILSVLQKSWAQPEQRNRFLIALLIGILLLAAAGGNEVLAGDAAVQSPDEIVQPAGPEEQVVAPAPVVSFFPTLFLGSLAGLSLLAAAYFLLRGYGFPQLRAERSFDLLIILGTLVLPMLAPLPVQLLGWDPIDYSYTGMLRTSVFLVPLALIAAGIGLWWNARLWLANAALFYIVFTVFYTTIFTNGAGFFTGMVGSLGYWLDQHGVQRGNQPWYYYLFLQVPVYEYLAALGSLLALVLGVGYWLRLLTRQPAADPRQPDNDHPVAHRTTHLVPVSALETGGTPGGVILALALIGYWVVTSAVAYSVAGEKMPWLTVHIALPMLLLAGWSIGYLIENIDWQSFHLRRGFLVLAVIPVFLISLIQVLGLLAGTNRPFQGRELEQLQATSSFLTALLIAVASGWILAYLLKSWPAAQIRRLLALSFFGLLALLTARTSIMASYINYDNATEYLVYAHSGPGNKLVLSQIEEISRRTTGALAVNVAYDNETTYPFWWYLRNYPNQHYYGTNPTRDLRESPIILVGDKNYRKVEPVVGQAYHRFDYIRMWWPNQDYYNLTWERIWDALSNPQMRSAVFQIWLNRDYTLYGQLTSKDMSLHNWSPSAQMRMYIRKDVAVQLWNYGVSPSPDEIVADPYEGKEATLIADAILGSPGSEPGQFLRPRGLVVAADGSLYVADTENHRIQHLARDGSVINMWGSFSGDDPAAAPAGAFNQPWGIALGPDGSVYIADLWNHRIQKFSAAGEFLTMWGYFGQAETPLAFWGPRDVAATSDGRVLVTDTGNKRVVIFDADGNYLNQFGSTGFAPGEFDEPVGIALDAEDYLYVADTWNQRIQVFAPDGAGSYVPVTFWEVYTWIGQSLDNKPYLAVGERRHVFATDPEGSRVLEFTHQGEIVRAWGDFSLGPDGFGLAGAVAADPAGGVWVSDTDNGRLMHFTLPGE